MLGLDADTDERDVAVARGDHPGDLAAAGHTLHLLELSNQLDGALGLLARNQVAPRFPEVVLAVAGHVDLQMTMPSTDRVLAKLAEDVVDHTAVDDQRGTSGRDGQQRHRGSHPVAEDVTQSKAKEQPHEPSSVSLPSRSRRTRSASRMSSESWVA